MKLTAYLQNAFPHIPCPSTGRRRVDNGYYSPLLQKSKEGMILRFLLAIYRLTLGKGRRVFIVFKTPLATVGFLCSSANRGRI